MRADPLGRRRRVAEIATRQHGVIAHRQLVALGFSRGTISRWLASGQLHRVHYGVYAVGHRRLTARGRWMAAVLALGEHALLSHVSGAALWDLLPIGSGRVHVTARAVGVRRRKGIAVHETTTLHVDDRAARDDIPVTSVARTLLDVAEIAPRRLTGAWDTAERLRLLDVRAVASVCDRNPGRRGLKHLVPLVERDRLVPDTKRELEALFFDLCRRYGLPLPSCNVLVKGFLVDAFWPEHKLIVELDSWEFHRGRRAFEDDRERDAALQPEYRVIRITWRRLTERPDEVAAQLRRVLNATRP